MLVWLFVIGFTVVAMWATEGRKMQRRRWHHHKRQPCKSVGQSKKKKTRGAFVCCLSFGLERQQSKNEEEAMLTGKTGKERQHRQGKLANKNCSIIQTTTKSCKKGGRKDANSSFLWQEAEARICLLFGLKWQWNKNKGEATPMVSSFVCWWSNLLVAKKKEHRSRGGCLVAGETNLSEDGPIYHKKGKENRQKQVVWWIGVTINGANKKTARRGANMPKIPSFGKKQSEGRFLSFRLEWQWKDKKVPLALFFAKGRNLWPVCSPSCCFLLVSSIVTLIHQTTCFCWFSLPFLQ